MYGKLRKDVRKYSEKTEHSYSYVILFKIQEASETS